jgi:hypothetical protein
VTDLTGSTKFLVSCGLFWRKNRQSNALFDFFCYFVILSGRFFFFKCRDKILGKYLLFFNQFILIVLVFVSEDCDDCYVYSFLSQNLKGFSSSEDPDIPL